MKDVRTLVGRIRTSAAGGVMPPGRAARTAGRSVTMPVKAALAAAGAVGFVYLARKELPALKREYRLLRM